MKIFPLEGEIQLKVETQIVGGLDTSSRDSAIEYGEVIAVGIGVEGIKKGDFIFFKSWAVDIINHDGKKYHFISLKTKGIKAIVK